MSDIRQLMQQKINLHTCTLLLERNIANQGEAVKPFLNQLAQDVEREDIKKWIKANFRKWLINDAPYVTKLTSDNIPDDAPQWMIDGVNSEDGLYNLEISDELQSNAKQLIDFITQESELTGDSLSRTTVQQVIDKIEAHSSTSSKRAAKRELRNSQVEEAGTEIVKTYKDGWTWRKVTSEDAVRREGNLMNNCMASHKLGSIVTNQVTLLSLRNPNNVPRVDLMYNSSNKRLMEVKGFNNKPPSSRDMTDRCFDIVYQEHIVIDNVGGDWAVITSKSNRTILIDPVTKLATPLDLLSGNYEKPITILYDTRASNLSNKKDHDNDSTNEKHYTQSFSPIVDIITIGVPGTTLQLREDVLIDNSSQHADQFCRFNCDVLVAWKDLTCHHYTVLLPNNLAVNLNCDLRYSMISKMSEGIRVGGDLYLPRHFRSLPTQMKVGGHIYFPNSKKAMLEGTNFLQQDNLRFIFY